MRSHFWLSEDKTLNRATYAPWFETARRALGAGDGTNRQISGVFPLPRAIRGAGFRVECLTDTA
jgi:hypothetical protein